MGGLFGGKQSMAPLRRQEARAALEEERQAAQLAARRRAAGAGRQSKTLFSTVLGIDDSIRERTSKPSKSKSKSKKSTHDYAPWAVRDQEWRTTE